MHLNCGFNCVKKCHLCDAGDWHNLGPQAGWRSTCGANRNGSPFKQVQIPLLTIPGLCQETILPDSLHCFHLGWGQDLGASGVVLLAKLGFFAGRSLDDKLADAYKVFTQWISLKKKTIGIDWWSKQKMDMKSTLFTIHYFLICCPTCSF